MIFVLVDGVELGYIYPFSRQSWWQGFSYHRGYGVLGTIDRCVWYFRHVHPTCVFQWSD